MFNIKIDTTNAAFGESTNDKAQEVARILHYIAHDLLMSTDYSQSQTIHDANGNDIGRAKLTTEEDEVIK